MRQLCYLVLLLILAAASLAFSANGGAVTQPAPIATPVRQITLGNSVAILDGQWKFHIGDNMAWAQPDFDDSAWGTMDLTPPLGSRDPILGTSGFVPGWTERGYKGYSGYAWYRLRVDIDSSSRALILKMPASFTNAYQVYANGKLIGQFGRFTAQGVTAYNSQPRAFPLQANLGNGPATIAIRMWMASYTSLALPDAGGLFNPPILGEPSAIDALVRLDWYAINRSLYSVFVETGALLLALLVALWLFWLDRSERSFFWLGLTCVAILVYIAFAFAEAYSFLIPVDICLLAQDAILTPLATGLWIVFWAYWFRLGGMEHLHRIVWSLVVLLGIGMSMQRAPLYGTYVPVQAAAWLAPMALVVKLLLGVVLVWVTVRGIRKNRVEGWFALFPIFLVIVAQYQEQLVVFHVPVIYFPFGFYVDVSETATVLSLLIVTVLLLRRFFHGQRERERWKSELEQARHIQSMLVPVKPPATPGFSVESVYIPASEVGGDFFHLRPGEDGSLLVVVGDVSGKGLKAAMTVSTIVGALRNEQSRQPTEILTRLNRVLHGQIQGFATCCVTLIAADGSMTIANAGHIPPYRNGTEMGIPGDIPLGILPDVKYEEHRFELAPGDRLTFVTDGIVEAMNAQRELFGFERTQQISHQPAAVIAETAKQFGQEDDITVLSVVFEPAKVSPATPSLAAPAPLQTAESV